MTPIPAEIMKEARELLCNLDEATDHASVYCVALGLMARDERAARIAFAAMFDEANAVKARALSDAILSYPEQSNAE